MGKLIDRYLFLELLIPFSLTLSALMMILLTEQMVRLAELFVHKGVSLFTVGKVFIYLLPTFLVIAIPMAVLIATIIGFSRLTADNEITALKAGGISLFRLAYPVHAFTLLAFILTLSLSTWAKPWVGRSLKTAALDLIQQEFSLGLEPGIFNEPFENMMIYVDEMPTPTLLKGIVIYDFRDAARPVLILAREGTILNDPGSNLVGFRLLNGSQHREEGGPERYQWITFGKYEFRLDLTRAVKQEHENGEAAPTIQQLKQKLEASQTLKRDELRTLVEHYKTYSFPFSCLIFGVLGIPLGLVIKRGGRLGGFATGIAMALLYYVLMIIGDFLATSRVLTPLAAAWLPNLTMLLISTGFITGLTRIRFIKRLYGTAR